MGPLRHQQAGVILPDSSWCLCALVVNPSSVPGFFLLDKRAGLA